MGVFGTRALLMSSRDRDDHTRVTTVVSEVNRTQPVSG